MLCVCLEVCDSDKCCVFFWMCGTQTSSVCLLCLFTVSVPSPGFVGLGQVLCVCLDVWDLDKCCVFFWMCGTHTSGVCLSVYVGFRQVRCVCLDV